MLTFYFTTTFFLPFPCHLLNVFRSSKNSHIPIPQRRHKTKHAGQKVHMLAVVSKSRFNHKRGEITVIYTHIKTYSMVTACYHADLNNVALASINKVEKQSLKNNLSVDYECKCQILTLIHTYTSLTLPPTYIQNSHPNTRHRLL